MTSWAYRATPSGTTFEQTVSVVTQHHFLWRGLFKRTAQRSRSGHPPTYSHLGDIDPDQDRLFLYFSEDGHLTYVGAYAFTRRRPCAHPTGAAPAVVAVSGDEPLHAVLEAAGYEPDAYLDAFTGFEVTEIVDGEAPPGDPVFDGQYSIGRFPTGVTQPSKVIPLLTQQTQPGLQASPGAMSGRCFGVDWSGAARAGDKVWSAELDPSECFVRSVGRPWVGATALDVIVGVASWLGTLTDAWVAFDFPFGIAAADRPVLLGTTIDDPRRWGAALQARHSTIQTFNAAATAAGLIGVHRRATDGASPFAPLLLQLIRQTYWGLRLLARMPETASLLPWEHAKPASVRVLETCPAVLLRALGLSNHGYKLKPGSELVREQLLTHALAATGWTCAPEVRQAAVADKEGDALDAVLAGLAAWRASALDHSAVAALPSRRAEGHIYA